MPNLGEKIRSFRETKGLSRLYVATRIGVSLQTLSRIERGAPVVWESLQRLALLFEVSMETLREDVQLFDPPPDSNKRGSKSQGVAFNKAKTTFYTLSKEEQLEFLQWGNSKIYPVEE